MFRFSRWLCAVLPTSDDISAAFRVLGLDASCPQHVNGERVRAQYLRLARLHHPDLSSGDDHKMKVINTAYEMLQSSGVLNTHSTDLRPKDGSSGIDNNTNNSSSVKSRFKPKVGLRRRRVLDDFADGDTWSMKSTMEWKTMMNSAIGLNSVSEEELKNPANHPFSHSKFFSFEDDISIYRMIRGGATVRQVARTLGMAATFVEKRLHNAQFKQRVQYVLRHEKRSDGKGSTAVRKNVDAGSVNGTEHVVGEVGGSHTTMYQKPPPPRSSSTAGGRRRKEWEPTIPDWEPPAFFADMSLEEKGRHEHLLREVQPKQQTAFASTGAVSKVSRSYANYARFGAGRSKMP